jgi:hypothetical protein
VYAAAAFCPCPPLLVPELAQGAAGELDALRAACVVVARRLVDAAPDGVVVVGPGRRRTRHPAQARGSLRGFGLDLQVGGSGPASLPASLTVGAWLLDRVDSLDALDAPEAGRPVAAVPRTYLEVPGDPDLADGVPEADPPEGRVGLLVMGDGSACRGPKGPGGERAGAEQVDEAVAAALATGDAAALAALDPSTARRLLVGGLPAWRAAVALLDGSRVVEADLLAHQSPYGVGYLVAYWALAEGGPAA